MLEMDDIKRQLNNRFLQDLPEFYRRRIIFWHDEDREFEDKLDDFLLDNAKLVCLTGCNNFTIKKLLSEEDLVSNYLVYDPLSYAKPDKNWLLDIELYSEEFRADLISIRMDEMSIAQIPALRKLMKQYHSFINAVVRRQKLATFANDIKSPAGLHLAVMASICRIQSMQPTAILRAIFRVGMDKEQNTIYQEIVNYTADTAFWAMVAQATGYHEGEDSDIGRLAIHIILTGTTRTLKESLLVGLENYISVPHQAFCYDFISDWLHSDDLPMLFDIARYVEEEANLVKRFQTLDIDDLKETECFPCVNEAILSKIMMEISEQVIDTDSIVLTVEKRRTMVWYDKVANFYDGILQVAYMQAFFHEHHSGFHTVEPKLIWKQYTEDYYKMDTYYRLFHLCFEKSLKESNPVLDDLFKHVMEKVEGLYLNWFLAGLGQNWSDASDEQLEKYGRVLEVPQQNDFYNDVVKKRDSKLYVIISDALRYEVAAELSDQLRRETQSDVTLKSHEAIFPTETKFGMAALLPHNELTPEYRNEKILVLADGQSTESNNRDKLLKQENALSIALKYKDIVAMKSTERSELVKGMDIVYIYHDKIDETSHNSETAVFSACDDAITELKNMVNIIVNQWGGVNIVITADHGFLYTYSPLKEDDKVDNKSFIDRVLEYGRRFAIMQKDSEPDHLMKVQFMNGNSDFEAYAPRENVRIKMRGGGMNFVHGGISLQEMVVPIIHYKYLRSSTMAYKRNKDKYDTKPVTLSLLSASHKISNMIFNLNFYQKDAVSANREAAKYLLYFTDENGKQISDIQKIIADKISDNSADRQFRLCFNLKQMQYKNTETYYLVIENEDRKSMELLQREEFQIDIAFAMDEFDFFGGE